MIVLPMAFVTESAAHPGLITLIPVLGAVLIIAAEPDAFSTVRFFAGVR